MSSRKRGVSQSQTKVRVAQRERRITLRREWQKEAAMKAISALTVGPDSEWVVTISPLEYTRTIEQNRLYWAIVDELCRASGQDKEAMHEWLKGKFLGSTYVVFRGEAFEYSRSTTKLSVAEFSAFVTEVEAWAAEHLGITVML